MEYNAEQPTEGAPWKRIDINPPLSKVTLVAANDTPAAGNEKTCQAQYSELSEDEQKVMELAHEKNFVRVDVEGLLRCKESKAGTVIKSLKEKGLLDEKGQGKATTYGLRASTEAGTLPQA